MDEEITAFDQLTKCHRRLEERLDDLAAAAARAEEGDFDVESVRAVVSWFGRGLRRHEEDEERSLFPRLSGHPELAAVVETLKREHAEHAPLHARLEAVVAELEQGRGARELAAVSDALTRAYRTHLDLEESTLFPAARDALGEAGARAIAEEMSARRDADGGGRGRNHSR